jgi:hypothetical protein
MASRLGRAAVVALFALFAGSAMVSGDALAQPKPPSDEARALARDAWKAFDAQSYKEALEKVTQAEALYHAPTHMLLMGNTLVALGRLAEGLSTFENLAAEPLSDAGPPAFKTARETGRTRMKELLSRVPSLLVVVEGADGVVPVITVDGKKLDFASGVAVRLDPGEHAISVTADGFVTASKSIKLPEKGGVVRVPIALEKVGASVPTASASAAAAGTSAPSTTALASASAATTGDAPSRAPAYAAFTVAGVGIVAGAVVGGLSMVMTRDLKARCPNNLCAPDDRSSLDTANVLANVSTAAFVIGGVAATVGVVILAAFGSSTSSPKRAAAGGVQIEPWISAGSAGLRGRF